VIFDTDIIIHFEKGNKKALSVLQKTETRYISTQTYLELLQCPKSKRQQDQVKSYLADFNFETLPFSANIGHRAAIYIEEYSLSHGIMAGDAIIAATAIENNLPLCSSNAKHYKFIHELQLKVFKP
jgi:predicted nucleic acid-binding protein